LRFSLAPDLALVEEFFADCRLAAQSPNKTVVELRGFELRLLGNAFADVWQFVGEPEGQGFDLRIPGCEVQIRSDNGPEVQCHLRGVPQEAPSPLSASESCPSRN
jgi:hypothetical protein